MTELTASRPIAHGRLRVGALAACALVGFGYLAVADPHDRHAVMPVCPVKLITGLDCPACGGLRLVHDLLRGQLGAAAHDNLFLLLISPLLFVLVVRAARDTWRGTQPRLTRRAGLTIATAAVCWMVLRNLPFWPLRPS